MAQKVRLRLKVTNSSSEQVLRKFSRFECSKWIRRVFWARPMSQKTFFTLCSWLRRLL